uniref:Putative secreted wc salivary protein n=1 Tax=Ixodes ricinus TaxID=34613 RepID=A0A090X8Z9_IXORI
MKMQLTLFIAFVVSPLLQHGVLCENDINKRDSSCLDFLVTVEEFACKHRGLGGFKNLDAHTCTLECENSSEKFILTKYIECQGGSFNCEKNRKGLEKLNKEHKEALKKIKKRFL